MPFLGTIALSLSWLHLGSLSPHPTNGNCTEKALSSPHTFLDVIHQKTVEWRKEKKEKDYSAHLHNSYRTKGTFNEIKGELLRAENSFLMIWVCSGVSRLGYTQCAYFSFFFSLSSTSFFVSNVLWFFFSFSKKFRFFMQLFITSPLGYYNMLDGEEKPARCHSTPVVLFEM